MDDPQKKENEHVKKALIFKLAIIRRKFNLKSVFRKCSVKKVFLNILKISQKNTCSRVYFIKKETPENFAKLLRTPIL